MLTEDISWPLCPQVPPRNNLNARCAAWHMPISLITGLLCLQVLPRNNLSAPALASIQQGQGVDRQVVQAAVDASGKVLVTVDVRPAPANHARRGVGETPLSLLHYVDGSWGCANKCAPIYEA